jgi:hypothetical protein
MIVSRAEHKLKALGIYKDREKHLLERVETNWLDFLDEPHKLCSVCGSPKEIAGEDMDPNDFF